MNQKGQILLLVIMTVALVLISTVLVIGGSQLSYNNATYAVSAEKATAIAEAGLDKAVASLNKSGGSYTGETETVLGDGSYSVVITSKDASTKVIEATGYLPDKTNPKVRRAISIEVSKGVGVSFAYGIQVGDGGLEMNNSNQVNGSIYSNGNIVGGNSNSITGDVWVAGGVAPSPNQETDCSGSNCSDFLFGKSISGENRLDISQSFKLSQTALLNKISLKLKKFGNPPDVTVRILSDNNGSPNKNGVLATGTLYNNLVTGSYGFIDITFPSPPNLTAETTYWMTLDTSANSSNYWSWQNDLAQSYTRGSAKWSSNWNAGSPVWNSFAGDLSFKTYIGGVITSIQGGNGFTVGGNVHANTISGLTVQDDAYYQSISNSSVQGTSHPGSVDPSAQTMPISDANIAEWKQAAENASITTGNITNCVSTLGPGKIVGNVSFNNSCNITVRSPVWITGTFDLNNSNILTLASDYGSSSGVIIVDGVSSLGNSNKLEGSGSSGSVLVLLSTYDSRTSGIDAIDINNSGNTGVLYAGIGSIEINNSSTFKELTAWKLKVNNSTTVNYESGLASTFFSSGPSGSFSLIKGTYQGK